MRIISRRKIVTTTNYRHCFDYEGENGHGFGFDCDEHGNLKDDTQDVALSNYAKCLTGIVDGHRMVDRGIVEYKSHYTKPTIIECSCGEHVALGNFTNTCHNCYSDYNMSGQLLADRSQWGEETGESLSDILSIR